VKYLKLFSLYDMRVEAQRSAPVLPKGSERATGVCQVGAGGYSPHDPFDFEIATCLLI
jgi:hypothetical protein